MGWSTTTRPSPHFSGSQGASSTSPCRRTGPLTAASVPSTEVTSGQPRQGSAGRSRRSGNHVGHVGPVRESGVAGILVHEEVGAAGSGCCPLQVWTRMFLVLHGHMRGSIRRKICDFMLASLLIMSNTKNLSLLRLPKKEAKSKKQKNRKERIFRKSVLLQTKNKFCICP